MAKRKRVKYEHGGLHKTIKDLVSASFGKENPSVTFSRKLGAGTVSATIGQQPKHFTSRKYGQETYANIQYTRKF